MSTDDIISKSTAAITEKAAFSGGMIDKSLHATDFSRLVNVEGKLGLFTPLTDPDDGLTSNENLEQIIQLLRDQVAELQGENQSLRQGLKDVAEASRRTPDDFAAAIGHSVDSLQARLYNMQNPVSRFAMREFSIEANVHVGVTALGTVEYRFLEPEEKVDPNRLSKINMSLVPIPKDSAGWDPADFTPFSDIEEIQGIGEAYQRRLNQHNIFSVSDLIHAGTRARSKVELAAMLEVDRNKLSVWLGQAELMTIKSIDGRKAEVLHNIGIHSLEQLATQVAETLTSTFNEKVAEMNHATLKPVEQTEVEQWITAALSYVKLK